MIRLLLAVAAVALPAHVEPQTSEAPAGARATFGFLVEHGCDGSPTVQVSIQLPDRSSDPEPVAPAGWTGVVEAGSPPVVTFTGGPLADDVPETFSVSLVTPDRAGETVLFPTVQTCESGEIGWVATEEGAEEPAPRIVLVEDPDPVAAEPEPTSTTIVEAHDPEPADEGPSTTQVQSIADDEASEDDDGSGAVVAVVVALLLAAAIGAALALRRRRRASSAG